MCGGAGTALCIVMRGKSHLTSGDPLVVMFQIIKLIELGRAIGNHPILADLVGGELLEVKQEVQVTGGYLSTPTTPFDKIALFGMMLPMTTGAQRHQIVR